MRQRAAVVLMLAILASVGCRRGETNKSKTEKVTLGEVRLGKESTEFYVAYGFDSAVLGFSVPTAGGRTRYFPVLGSTYRGIPSVVLEVFVSRSGDEMWIRSSWADAELIAYYRVGTETALTLWGEVRFIEVPMPDVLGGRPVTLPALVPANVVKKATFKFD